MSLSKFSSSKIKSIIVHLVVLILAYEYVIYAENNYYVEENLKIYNNILIIVFFYVHSFLLLSIIIEKNNLKRYLLYTIVCFVFINTIESWFGALHSSKITHFEDGTRPSPYHFFLRKDWVIGHAIGLMPRFVTVGLISFVYGYLILKIKLQESFFNLKLSAKESELQLLKSQVNPHFLFNTLNTLYATALEEQAPKTAESTAKLASLLRYMQEDINKEFIPLENEIKYVQDYIAIQKLRCSVTPQIETKFENIDNKVISPGLLIPFVENAFKYGIDPSKPSKLKVSVICDEDTIHFECVNSYDDNFETYYKEQGFGIGIKNAKQRLELVYPKKHQLEVKKENNIFSVTLSVITK